jgi:hypothetical protein
MSDRRFPIGLVAGIGAVFGAAFAARYGFIEPTATNLACKAAMAPLWCVAREATVALFNAKAFGLASIVLGALAHLPVPRPEAAGAAAATGGVSLSRAAAVAALAVAAVGLVLYNTELSAVGFLLGLLRAVQPKGP